MNSQTRVTVLAILLTAASGYANILNNATGLANPAETITFSEHSFSQNTLITNQFSDLGVTFSPGMFYDPQNGFSNLVGDYLGNFNSNFTVLQDPFSIFFSTPQTSAAFAMKVGDARVTIAAFLSGNQVDSFTGIINSATTDFWGFTGETFDQISVSLVDLGDGQLAVIDNLELGTVAPEPGTFALVSIALLAALTLARKRARPRPESTDFPQDWL